MLTNKNESNFEKKKRSLLLNGLLNTLRFFFQIHLVQITLLLDFMRERERDKTRNYFIKKKVKRMMAEHLSEIQIDTDMYCLIQLKCE